MFLNIFTMYVLSKIELTSGQQDTPTFYQVDKKVGKMPLKSTYLTTYIPGTTWSSSCTSWTQPIRGRSSVSWSEIGESPILPSQYWMILKLELP